MKVLASSLLLLAATLTGTQAFAPASKAFVKPATSLQMVEFVDDEHIGNVFAANKKWKAEKEAGDPEFFDKLGTIHQPKYMWIGCADARVPANEIMGLDAGEVFVARNVANMVVNTDFNLLSALQYAVNVLKVQHIVVCGHYECGGVKASMTNRDHQPPLENWLRNIRDVYRIHKKELDAIADDDARHKRLVELNVVEQCLNLFKTGDIQRNRALTSIAVEAGEQPYTTPRVHAMVFDPKDGILKRLDVNFDDYVDELSEIYQMYGSAR